MEIWKPIKNFEGYYEVSNLGRVRSLDRKIIRRDGTKVNFKGKVLSTKSVTRHGYVLAPLYKEGDEYGCTVHRLVAEAFCEKPEGCTQVDHINGDKTDNRVENLQWVSASENIKRAYRNGRNHNVARVPIIAISPDGKETLCNSQAEAGKVANVTQAAVSYCLRDNSKTKTGYSFKRQEVKS